MKFEDPNELEFIAGEYVLGNLGDVERTEVEREIRSNPGLQKAVAFWEKKLIPLVESLPPEDPPHTVWNGIENNMEAGEAQGTVLGSFWSSLKFWRPVALLASAAVLILFLYYGYRASPPEPVPQYIALLSSPEAPPHWLVNFDPSDQKLTAHVLQIPVLPPGKSMELWMIPPEAGDPVSCGILPNSGKKTFALTPASMELLMKSKKLAVTLEPEGGSPTGKATGPVLYQGELLPI